MKIGYSTKTADKNSEIDPRFGRANFFLIHDEENDDRVGNDLRIT